MRSPRETPTCSSGPDPKAGASEPCARGWITSFRPVGDEVYLYYGGYASGQKLSDRQIGLLKMRRDRYVAREAGERKARLTTKPLTLDAAKMTVNADAAKGSVAVGLLDAAGKAGPRIRRGRGGRGTRRFAGGGGQWKRKPRRVAEQAGSASVSAADARLFAFTLE